jgi:putative DNA primase/helicase
MTDEGQVRVVATPRDPLVNARRFLRERFDHADHRTLVAHGGILLLHEGSHWRELEEDRLVADLWEYLGDAVYPSGTGFRAFSPTPASVKQIVEALRAATYLSRDIYAPSWLGGDGPFPAAESIACRNGILHVPDRRLIAHTPRFFVQHAVPLDYEQNAPEPAKWLEFLQGIWPNDPEMPAALQEMFGYILSGDTSLQKMFLLIGPPRSGKSTIARVLISLMGGSHRVAGPTLNSLSTNFGLQPLIGKSLAVIADARLQGGGQPIVLERLLSISGEDMLTIDRKNLTSWTGTLPTRIVMLTNELPRLSDSSGAVASRFIPYETEVSFLGREDPNLPAKLLTELPGILNWALDGLDRVAEQNRLTVPAASASVQQDLEAYTSPVSQFVRDRCIVDSTLSCTKEDLYREWQRWSAGQGHTLPITRATFGVRLKAAVPSLDTGKRTTEDGRKNLYIGIGLQREPSQ